MCVIFIFIYTAPFISRCFPIWSELYSNGRKLHQRWRSIVFLLVSRDRGAEGCLWVDSRRACPPLPLAKCWPMVRRRWPYPCRRGLFLPSVFVFASHLECAEGSIGARIGLQGQPASRELWGVRACEQARNACSDFSSPHYACTPWLWNLFLLLSRFVI